MEEKGFWSRFGSNVSKAFGGFYDFMSSDKVQRFGDNLDGAFSMNREGGKVEKKDKEETKEFNGSYGKY